MDFLTFLHPWWLLLLPLTAALAAGYVLAARRRARYTVKFTNTDLLKSVMPRRPRWRRHVPPALMLLAVALVTVGLADPAVRVPGEEPRGTVVLAVDVSPSMMATDVSPSRFDAMRDAVRSFVEDAPDNVDIGLVSFAGTANVEVAPTRDREHLLNGLDQLEYRSDTSLAQAVFAAHNAIQTATDATARANASVVLLSDGGSTVSPPLREGITTARESHIPVSTIALGTQNGEVTLGGSTQSVPVDTDELTELAQETGGETFDATSEVELQDTYEDIGTSLEAPKEPHSIAHWFFLLALVSLIGAGALSLLWFSGLP